MSALLEVKHADISFGGIHAMKDLSFIVHAGEIVGLIGPNGSGKSTCVNLISGTYQLDAGEIWFDGKLIPQKNEGRGSCAAGDWTYLSDAQTIWQHDGL